MINLVKSVCFISQVSVIFSVMPKVKNSTFYKIYKCNNNLTEMKKKNRQFRDVRLHIEISFLTKAICSFKITYIDLLMNR